MTRLGAGDQVSRPRRGASEIAVGQVRGRRFLATIEPWHGEQLVVYFEAKPGELWSRHMIDDGFRQAMRWPAPTSTVTAMRRSSPDIGARGPAFTFTTARIPPACAGTPNSRHRDGCLRGRHRGYQRGWSSGHRCDRRLHGQREVVRESGLASPALACPGSQPSP